MNQYKKHKKEYLTKGFAEIPCAKCNKKFKSWLRGFEGINQRYDIWCRNCIKAEKKIIAEANNGEGL